MGRAAGTVLFAALALAACGSTKGKDKIELSPHHDPASFHRAMSYSLLRTRQHARAVPYIRRLIDSKPKTAEPQYLMARAMLGMDLLPQAREALDRAVTADPKFAPAHSLLGLLLDRQGDHVSAERSHRRALQLGGRSAAYLNNLGFCLYLQGRFDEAVATYRKALAQDPAARRVHNNLAFAYGKGGDLGKARKHFALAGDPAQVDNNLGLVYESKGQLDQAYDAYLRALTADADQTVARENLNRVCLKLGRPVPQVTPNPPARSKIP